jgi:ATP-dependent protease HslVU (ClpYQ) peptidase subunit
MNQPSRLRRAEQACAELAASGQPVTFTAVAARTGIGRVTLYRDTELRAVIDDHRSRAASSNTITGLAGDIAALRTALEALAARVRHHEEQLRQLDHANTRRAHRQ